MMVKSSIEHEQMDLFGGTAETYVSMSDLRERGWTRGMVRTLLGLHDKLDRSVIAPKSPRRLWESMRVFDEEIKPSFSAQKNDRAKRSKAAANARHQSKAQALEAALHIAIDLSRVPDDYPEKTLAIAKKFGVQQFEIEEGGLVLGWECIATEHLMQSLASLHDALDEFVGKPGVVAARQSLEYRILTAIGERFPELEVECDRRRSEVT
jgi:hypothetical protein